ncbi:jg25383 [Pararge aegeria aegeria]|uniref:Jg25383 protein n=1 Tax=Pararge aegeria aegeria TaxID=348720 RepID=A0A8S4S1U9_9NEOP|nr:jg25383 [Pararge aegeria aegeria]
MLTKWYCLKRTKLRKDIGTGGARVWPPETVPKVFAASYVQQQRAEASYKCPNCPARDRTQNLIRPQRVPLRQAGYPGLCCSDQYTSTVVIGIRCSDACSGPSGRVRCLINSLIRANGLILHTVCTVPHTID